MLANGLVKGALMLVLGASFTWALVHAFEQRARNHSSTGNVTASHSSIAHAAGVKVPGRLGF